MNENQINKIEGRGKPVKDVLSQKYTIDYFQREYRWERKHIEQMLYDLTSVFKECYKKGDDAQKASLYKSYFMGPYIVTQRQNGTFSLIDGQQRFTSLTLLLIYLSKLSPDSACDIFPLIYGRKYGKASYNLQIPDRKGVMDYLYNEKEIEDESLLDSSSLTIMERYADIEELFNDELKKPEVVEVFIYWLLENVQLVEILSYSDENAYTIFETMNDRGCNLTSTEMLKSLMLSKINESQIRSDCNESWRQTFAKLLAEGKDFDGEFVRAWLRAKYCEIKSKDDSDFENVGVGFHRWVKDNLSVMKSGKSSHEIEMLIKEDLPFYAKWLLYIRGEERYGSSLMHLMDSFSMSKSLAYPLYLAPINQTDTEVVIKEKIGIMAKTIDCFIVRRLLGNLTVAQASIRYTVYSFILRIRSCNLEELKEACKKFISDSAPMVKVLPLIKSLSIKFIRYVVYRINCYTIPMTDINGKSYLTSSFPQRMPLMVNLKGNDVSLSGKDYKTLDVPLSAVYSSTQKFFMHDDICKQVRENEGDDMNSMYIQKISGITNTDDSKRMRLFYTFIIDAIWGDRL